MDIPFGICHGPDIKLHQKSIGIFPLFTYVFDLLQDLYIAILGKAEVVNLSWVYKPSNEFSGVTHVQLTS